MNNQVILNKEDRINELEDQRFEKLCDQVDGLHKLLVQNGLLTKVTEHDTSIKWICRTIKLLVLLIVIILGSIGYKVSPDIVAKMMDGSIESIE